MYSVSVEKENAVSAERSMGLTGAPNQARELIMESRWTSGRMIRYCSALISQRPRGARTGAIL
jgi:hypothetical protein